MNAKQALGCVRDFLNETKPDAKGRIFVDFDCKINCAYKTMCLKVRSIVESTLNGGLK